MDELRTGPACFILSASHELTKLHLVSNFTYFSKQAAVKLFFQETGGTLSGEET